MKKIILAVVLVTILSTSFVRAGSTTDLNGGKTTTDLNGGKTTTDVNGGKTTTDENTQVPVFTITSPLDPKFNSVGGLINGFVDIFTYLVILFAVLMIIYVGLRFVMAQGNMEEIKTRKDQLLWLMVGVAIVIGARIMISVVLNTLEATGVVKPEVINSGRNAINGR